MIVHGLHGGMKMMKVIGRQINSSKHLSGSSFQSWRRGEPNGETLENCVSLHQDGKYVALNYKKISHRMSFLQVIGWIDLVVIRSVLYVT